MVALAVTSHKEDFVCLSVWSGAVEAPNVFRKALPVGEALVLRRRFTDIGLRYQAQVAIRFLQSSGQLYGRLGHRMLELATA